ncbi:HNH endonuclease [Methylobacterium indicum]|uniref:HNH endonuclease n=1 Tax=Methylobacterium indicum TaxID=1775910 RepID=UPI0024352A7C|nr:hypothetical protein [Methylobacterium indicum]
MILNPIRFDCEKQRQISDILARRDLSAADWSAEDIEEIRSEIKQYYIREQGYRCCYCNQLLLAHHGRVWDVEHVIPRSTKPNFMFEPKNLAVSCVECNGNKSAVQVTTRDYVRFTESSANYKIVHPHFDEFDEHIEIEGDYTYHALSPKGSFTIYHCDLFRFRQREANIRQPIRDKRFERDVGELRFAKTPEEAMPIVASIMAKLQILKDQNGD